MSLIQTKNLRKVFRTEEVETTALNGVNVQIQEGEFVAMMGPSGCGKSTLLNIIGLLDDSSDGEYHFLGQEVTRLSISKRAKLAKGKIGFIFQNFNLIDELTVFENIELPLLYQNVPAAEREAKVAEVLERVNLSHRRNHFPQQLSGGQQQRVAIARAVVSSPKIILADEPTGNLDSTNGKEVMDLLVGLNQGGTTIIMVTHSSHDASFASRVINLFDGEIVTEKTQVRELEAA